MNKRMRIKRWLAAALVLLLAFTLPGVRPDAETGTSRAAETTAAKTAEATALKTGQQPKTEKWQPRHLLAKAVERMQALESGDWEPSEADIDVQNLQETDYYYSALTQDEKLIYSCLADLYTELNYYESSDEFFDKCQSGGSTAEALADDIESGKVAVAMLTREYGKEERGDIYGHALWAFRLDHPYDFSYYLYKSCYRIVRNQTMYFAICRKDQAETFDLKQWGDSLIKFEQDALTTIVNDPRFSDTEKPIKEYLVHEFICSRVTYDSSKPPENTVRYYKIKTAFGPMVEHSGVCIGIAKMAKILLDDLEVDTYVVISKTHAWNLVDLGDAFYELDCTWDLSKKGEVSYGYFNLTTKALLEKDSKSHNRDDVSTRLPEATGTQYNYEGVCNLMGAAPEPDYDEDDDQVPPGSDDDYVGYDEGEVYPNQDNFEYEGMIFDLSSDGYATIKAVKGKPKTLKIPDTVYLVDEEYGDEYPFPVCAIDDGAFQNNKKLQKVTIPYEMVMIGDNAFRNCKKLKKIRFEGIEELYSIGSKAFKGIPKKAVITLAGDDTRFDEIKDLLREAGAPAKVKIKRG